jgi:hypothetical protein
VPVFAWISGGATAILREYGPKELGGLGYLREIDEEFDWNAKRVDDKGHKVGFQLCPARCE